MVSEDLVKALRDYDRCDTDDLMDKAADEIERLQAIVDKLPKDHQGKPIVPLVDRVWHPEDLLRHHADSRIVVLNRGGKKSARLGKWEAVPAPECAMSEYTRRSPTECFVARVAAEAAREE